MEAGKWRKGGIAMADISIIGAGSWGIALALLLHKNGHHITVWSIIQEEIDMLSKEHEHKEKLPGVKLPEDMEFTTDLEAAVKGKDILVLAVPSPFTRSTSHSMKEYVGEGQVIVNVAKGIEEKKPSYPFPDNRRRNSPGKSGGVVRPFPCGRSRTRHSYHNRRRGKGKNNCRMAAEHFYE